MLEEEIEREAARESSASRAKQLFIVGGGTMALLAVAFVFALMAVPDQPAQHALRGPFVAPMFTGEVRVNLSGDSRKRFAILELNVIYEAYDEDYYAARKDDALYAAELKDAVLGITSTKEGREIVDKAHKPVFLEEVRQAAEPLLFPVYLGNPGKTAQTSPTAADRDSGLALASEPSMFRGRFWNHVVRVNAATKTIAIDDGTEVTFDGTETALEVPAGQTIVYFDVTGLDADFDGELHVGVKGRIRRILWDNVLIN